MLRVSADCDGVPTEIIDVVNEISSHARQLVRSVCSSFLRTSSLLNIL